MPDSRGLLRNVCMALALLFAPIAAEAEQDCDRLSAEVSFCGAPNAWELRPEADPSFVAVYQSRDSAMKFGFIGVKPEGRRNDVDLQELERESHTNIARRLGIRRTEVRVHDPIPTDIDGLAAESFCFSVPFFGERQLYIFSVVIAEDKMVVAYTSSMDDAPGAESIALHRAFTESLRIN